MYAVSMTPTLDLQGVVRAQVGRVKEAMAPWAARHMYFNFAETLTPVNTLWDAPAFERLRAVKATVDPDNFLRANHSIPPAD